MDYAKQTDFTRKYDKFEYHTEDILCDVCANKRIRKHNCGRSVCEFQDLKDEAVKHNRIKRPRGWFNYETN